MKRILLILFFSIYILTGYGINIGIPDNNEYNLKLKEIFSKYYNIVPFSEKEKKIIIDMMKEQDLGLRKGEISKLPQVDYVIYFDEDNNIVYFSDINKLPIKMLKINNEWSDTSYRIINYFENFVLYFKLPEFEDKKARKGTIYMLMDENFKDIKYYKLKKKETHIKIKYPDAVYARRLRPSIFNSSGKLLYERKEGDLSLSIVDNPGITEFKDGDEISINIFVEEPGYVSIIDIYKNEIMVISSNYVDYGYFKFTADAYAGDGSKEMLLFVLSDDPITKENLSFEELKDLLESSKGMDLMEFVVRKMGI